MHLNILNTTASRFIALLILLVGSHAEAQSWTGSVSTNWNNPANWSPARVPASGANINIYSGSSYYPSVTNSLTIGTLQLYGGSLTVLTGTVTAGPLNTYSGSTLLIGSGGTINSPGSLTLGGNVTVNGALVCSGITLYNTSTLTINAAAKASNSGNLTIQGTLNLSVHPAAWH